MAIDQRGAANDERLPLTAQLSLHSPREQSHEGGNRTAKSRSSHDVVSIAYSLAPPGTLRALRVSGILYPHIQGVHEFKRVQWVQVQ
jgi:hypothetical protein